MVSFRFSQPDKSLRIAMFSIHSSPTGELGTRDTGGMSVYLQALARNLGAAGNQVDIFTCASGGEMTGIIGPNVRLIHLFSSSEEMEKEHLSEHVSDIFHRMETFRQDRGIDYDLIHSHYWISGLVGALAQNRWHCPHMIMFHTLGLMKNTLAGGENESLERIDKERYLTRTAHHILVPTRQERNYLLEQYQAQPEKISIIPCGVDLDLFQPSERSAARRRLGISPSAEVLLFVGRFAPLKGLDRLIDAVAKLKSRHPDIELMIVGGDGPDAGSTRALKDRIARHQLVTNIRLAGRMDHDDLPCCYSAADALVLPSQYESFGLVVLEALACGTPVAATPVGAARTTVIDGQNGILFHSPTVEDIAVGLERLLMKVNSGGLSRQQIRAHVINYGWEKISHLVNRTYDLMLHNYESEQDRSVIGGNR